jgi:hypothetical protein
VDHDPAGQVGPGQPGLDPCAVPGIGVVVASQVQGGQPVRELGDGFQETEDVLVLDPVGHTQQAHPASLAEVDRGVAGGGRQVAARGHDPDPPGRKPLGGHLVAEGPAGHDEQAGPAVRPPVQRGLQGPPQRPVADPTWRLVQAADRRRPASPRQPWPQEGGGDTVQDEDIGLDLPDHGRAGQCGEGEGSIGEGDEDDVGTTRRSQLRHAAVVAIATGQAARVTESDQGDREDACHQFA